MSEEPHAQSSRPNPVEPADNPDEDFPILQEAHDHSGALRQFTIQSRPAVHGFSLHAEENVEDGYEFSAFDSTSPYLALGALRRKMRRALATRHLVHSEEHGGLTMLQEHVRGHIGYSLDADTIVFVVDGVPLSLDDIAEFAQMHEGWQFSLRFADPTDELIEP